MQAAVNFLCMRPLVLTRQKQGQSVHSSAEFRTHSASPEASRQSTSDEPNSLRCSCCHGRRQLLLLASASSLLQLHPHSIAAAKSVSDIIERVHPSRPDWYQELYARALLDGMKAYEAEVAQYKAKLFGYITDKAKNVLELGVGTGPNFKYYATASDRSIIGIDPNKQMEKYARAAAQAVGLPPTKFSFQQGVGESLPVGDETMDVVIGTLVLCSVTDVEATLSEIKRVLKPGGLYLFIEHVAARDGSFLRLMQTILDPLQQFVADGCHLTRSTGNHISKAGFSSSNLNMASLSTAFLLSPHVYGVACK